MASSTSPGVIVSGFGYRPAPKTNLGVGSSFHKGIDVAYPVGTPIVANTNLTFVQDKVQPTGAGNYSIFKDDNGNTYTLMHLNGGSGLTPGQKVNAGDTIAITGNTGNSGGPHLDFRLTDKNGNPVDPLAINPDTGKPYAGIVSAQGSDKGIGGVDKVGGEGASTGGKDLPGGANPAGQGAAGAGGEGGSSACASAALTAVASIAMGGLLQGLGMAINGPFAALTNALQQIPGVAQLTSVFQQATGLLNSGLGAINSLTNGALGAIGSMGAGILPGITNVIPSALQGAVGQLLSPITSVLANPLSLPSVVQQFTAAGGLGGFLQQVGGNMVGNIVGGSIANVMSNLQLGGGLSEITRSLTGGISEAMGQTFGNVTGGLGEMFRNMDGVLSYGMSTLGNNLGAVAANMISTGSWDASQLTRLMQPGAIAEQIIARGLGDATGIVSQLISNNIPIAGVNNPLYDDTVGKILTGINSTGAIDAVKSAFAVTQNISHLGDLTDITKMMPDVAQTLPVKSFEGLGQELIKLQITNAPNLTEIGSTLLKIENGKDLNHLSQLDSPMHKPTGELLLKTFGYGSGTYGELNTADFMGTPAGIVHNDTLPIIIDNMKFIQDHPEMQCFYSLVTLLGEVLNGEHRVTTTTGGGGGGGGGGA